MITINVRGLGSFLNDMQAVALDHDMPDIMVLTETKRSAAVRLYGPMKQLYVTCCSHTADGHAGVALLVSRKYRQSQQLETRPVPAECRGYLAHAVLTSASGSSLHIIAAYMPVTAEHVADRAAVYAYLSQLLAALPHTDAAVLSGDWNAALEATDRRGARSTALDQAHARWVAGQAGLASIYTQLGKRAPTYSVAGMGDSPSMIDDTLLRPGAGAGPASLVAAAGIQPLHGYATDHALLSATLRVSCLGLTALRQPLPARPLAKVEQRLVTPVSAADQAAFQVAMLDNQSAEIAVLHARLRELVEGQARPFMLQRAGENAGEVHQLGVLGGAPARNVIEELAAQVMALLGGAQALALQTSAV